MNLGHYIIETSKEIRIECLSITKLSRGYIFLVISCLGLTSYQLN